LQLYREPIFVIFTNIKSRMRNKKCFK